MYAIRSYYALIALVGATVVVKIFNLPVETIGSRFGEISNSISVINFSEFNITIETIKDLIMPAVTIALLASIESLLSAVVADGMIGKKHNSNMELIAQGIANIVSTLFGGIPATGAIARTAANIKNGGRTPIAGMVHAVMILLIMIIFMPLAKMIPMTTLAAILIVVSYNMSEWRSFKGVFKSTKSDISVLLVTFLLTVIFDLVIAIEIGMVLAMFLFVKRMADITRIDGKVIGEISFLNDVIVDEDNEVSESDDIHKKLNKNVFLYEINGPMFFGAASSFIDVLNQIKSQSSVLILKMNGVPVMDATALSAFKTIDKRCREKHILIFYSEINEQPLRLLKNAGFISGVGDYRFFESTEDAIVAANGIINFSYNFV